MNKKRRNENNNYKYIKKQVIFIKGRIGKKGYITVFLAVSMLFSQLAAVNAPGADAEKDGTLVIRHLAKVPGGKQYVLGTETIENITDVYYYCAEQSPVASGFLNSGYSLADEKNRLIEADVVANGGKIDLEYTPAVQSINVTYFKREGENERKMGTIIDSAYVGEEYIPQPPVFDGADVLATLIGEQKHIVKFGENNINVTYMTETAPIASAETSRRSDSGGKSVIMEAKKPERKTERASKFVYGYPDDTFRPENTINKNEMYSLFYSLSGGRVPKNGISYAEITAFLIERGIIAEPVTDGAVTWAELYAGMMALNEALEPGEKISNLESGQWAEYYEGERQLKRAEAVAAINKMLGQKRDYAELDNPFTDVYEDYWAYLDILNAAN